MGIYLRLLDCTAFCLRKDTQSRLLLHPTIFIALATRIHAKPFSLPIVHGNRLAMFVCGFREDGMCFSVAEPPLQRISCVLMCVS